MLRLQIICCIEPVLVFGTEQDTIIDSHRLSPKTFPKINQSEFGERHKECLLQKRYCLSEFKNEFSSGIKPSSSY
jgi:hypothetical protein